MKFGIIVFPGSNCDHDCYHVLKHVLGQEVEFIWHKQAQLNEYDCIILPGGFSYGDYLRPGAIARFSPVMDQIIEYTQQGKLLLGICNGFQVLLELGLLPGAMRDNRDLKFICEYVNIRVENNTTPFTLNCSSGQTLRIPIAHMQGNYYVDAATLSRMRLKGQIVFRYCSADGKVDATANPNGSLDNIAGICNPQGNVLGMMPHPERCVENILGSPDGKLIFDSIISWLTQRKPAMVNC
jgi:phosphoribosylformylglycinamidine synthase